VTYPIYPIKVRVTPDERFYACNFFTDTERLMLTDVGRNWWR
jgi:hypothetical protein